MKIQIKILGGARAGLGAVFSQPYVGVGRHPESDLQFDPERDLDVSTRHAALLHEGDKWYVRDLNSRNGTFVNGHRIRRDTHLGDTDQIRFGEDGPRVEVRMVGDGIPDERPEPIAAPGEGRAPRRTAASGASPPAPSPAAPAAEPAAAPAGRQSGTTQRIRAEVGRQTKHLRALTVILSVVLVAVVGYFVIDNQLQQRRRERDVQAMQARIDSIIAASQRAVTMLQGQNEGLADALRGSQSEVQRLQRDLTTATDAEVESLRDQLAAATARFEAQQVAAQVDYRAINEANQFAVAMIWADFGAGDVANGTAFAVAADGRLVTNRHVVAGRDGTRRPRQIAVQFNNSGQVWRARLVAVDRDVDLAIVQVLGISGSVPTVKGLAPDDARPAVGDPVAVIGFPHGDDLPMRSAGEGNIIRSTFTAGTVSKILPDLLQADGYGAPGASGSPVFNADGYVVGVLYGGEDGTSGRVIYGVPVRFLVELLGHLD